MIGRWLVRVLAVMEGRWFGWQAPHRPAYPALLSVLWLRWLAPLSRRERGVGGWWRFCGDVLVAVWLAALCPRFPLTPGSSTGQVLALSHEETIAKP